MNQLRYALIIHNAGFSQQSAQTALLFANALLAKGHQIHRVFFYQDGVYNANDFCITPQDETSILEQWQQLARETKTSLAVCVAAALRRGVLNPEEAARYEKNHHNLAKSFEITGLGQLIEATISADRVISFGA